MAVAAGDGAGGGRIRQFTPQRRCYTDLYDIIDDVNQVVGGWGAYFRTGNAARQFHQLDTYVVMRLRDLLLKRAGAQWRPVQVVRWRHPFFEALGLCRVRGTIRYPATA